MILYALAPITSLSTNITAYEYIILFTNLLHSIPRIIYLNHCILLDVGYGIFNINLLDISYVLRVLYIRLVMYHKPL